MRIAVAAIAVVALVATGTLEALESARQLAEQPGRGRPTLGEGGALLTLAGFVASVAVYAIAGWWLERRETRDAVALRIGIAVGFTAGLLGGTIRAALVSDYLGETVSGFGLPRTFATIALVVFVVLSIAASAAGGGAVTWLSFRAARARSQRPRS